MKTEHPAYAILAFLLVLSFGAYLQGLERSLERAWHVVDVSESRWRAPAPRAVKVGCRLVLEEIEVCSEALRTLRMVEGE